MNEADKIKQSAAQLANKVDADAHAARQAALADINKAKSWGSAHLFWIGYAAGIVSGGVLVWFFR